MGEIEKKIIPIFKNAVTDALGAEELFVEAAREMVKDEIKRIVRETLDQHPELREEFKQAIKLYFQARLKQAYANMKLGKSCAKLGLEIIPDEIRENIAHEFIKVFEKEIGTIFDRTL